MGHMTQVPQNLALSSKRISVDVIKLEILRFKSLTAMRNVLLRDTEA
jgi:hypothetical protein